MNTSYSQIGQDLWVVQFLNNKQKGYFLDIGAYDGIHYSNSYLLEHMFFWDGLLVEANPNNYRLLRTNRPNAKNLMYAITDYCGYANIDNIQMSSKINDDIHQTIKVPSMTFTELFKIYDVPKEIDYMSLDIEGYESKALSKFPFNAHKCNLVTVEHNLYINGPNNKNQIKEILTNNDYVLIKDNVSHQNNPFEDWYAHKSILS
jgi:FkbM family methyltransferase